MPVIRTMSILCDQEMQEVQINLFHLHFDKFAQTSYFQSILEFGTKSEGLKQDNKKRPLERGAKL